VGTGAGGDGPVDESWWGRGGDKPVVAGLAEDSAAGARAEPSEASEDRADRAEDLIAGEQEQLLASRSSFWRADGERIQERQELATGGTAQMLDRGAPTKRRTDRPGMNRIGTGSILMEIETEGRWGSANEGRTRRRGRQRPQRELAMEARAM
jgi:hypothetical protein